MAVEDKACGYTKLSQGKRYLMALDVPEAVSTLAVACELLAKQFGETHVECAEAYYFYGKALLEMSRLESDVLGNALDGVPECDYEDAVEDGQVEDPAKMTEEEIIEVGKRVKEALDFNYETSEIEIKKGEEEESENMDDEAASQEDCEEMEHIGTAPDGIPSSTKEVDDDEPGYLQQAWEMLELAKVIYTKHLETESECQKAGYLKRLSETYLGLGEVSVENENYKQAVEDFNICLDKRRSFLPADSRSIAETYYQLGVAQGYSENFSEALKAMDSAVSVLKTRRDNLQKMESSENLTKEIEDLQELIKDIEEKVEDYHSMKTEVAEKLKERLSGPGGAEINETASTIAVKRKDSVTAAAAN